MKRVYIKTEVSEKFSDGSQTTTKTERSEEELESGLFEAWGFLMLVLFSLLITGITYQFVSSIIQRSNSNGIQIQKINQ
ncbi:hypothetical protein SD81_040275 [Tolypothrix campylonemoides VB511288]|nr:hypothetical protein SD81_040275 [Tolypothrix campylonemoides VB511288]